jgi:hypothetical protein
MLKVRRTLVLAAGFAAFAFVPVAMMSAPTVLAQTMGEYGATVGSSASSAGTLGSAIGPENTVGSSIGGGGLNMGAGTLLTMPVTRPGQMTRTTRLATTGLRSNRSPTYCQCAALGVSYATILTSLSGT